MSKDRRKRSTREIAREVFEKMISHSQDVAADGLLGTREDAAQAMEVLTVVYSALIRLGEKSFPWPDGVSEETRELILEDVMRGQYIGPIETIADAQVRVRKKHQKRYQTYLERQPEVSDPDDDDPTVH